MCFSATASFGASVLLAGAGVVALKKNESPKMIAFASTPLVFSIHQLAEGVLWLTFNNPDLISWYKPSLYAYLFISQAFWPFWIPFIVWMMEPDSVRKKWMSYFLWLGVTTSIYLFYCLMISNVTAVAESGHIRYTLNFPTMQLRAVLYFLTTMVPLFLSSLRYMKLLAVTLLASLILSFIFYTYWVISVWCFFAAILSLLVLLIIAYNKEYVRTST